MFDMLLPVSIYLVDSILSGFYSQGFLKEKYGRKAVLAIWGAAYFLIQIAVYEILDNRFSISEVAGIIINVCVLLFMHFLFFEKDMQKQVFVAFSFVAGKEIVKYVVSVFSIVCNGLGNGILSYFIKKRNDKYVRKNEYMDRYSYIRCRNSMYVALYSFAVCISASDK